MLAEKLGLKGWKNHEADFAFKLKAVTTKDRTQAKAAPCPHCGASTRGKTLALPRCLNRGATLILSAVHDQCKKSVNFTKKTSPDAIPHDWNIADARVRTPPTLTVARFVVAKKRPRGNITIFILGLKKKNTQHLLSKQPRCQSSASEADNRCPTPEFNTHTTNYSIKVKGRGGKGKNLLSSPSKAVTSAPLSALFRKQSHPAACVIGQSKGGKTGKMVIILQLYVMKEGKNHKCQALGVLSLILVPVVAKRRVDGLPRSLSCGRGSGTEKRK